MLDIGVRPIDSGGVCLGVCVCVCVCVCACVCAAAAPGSATPELDSTHMNGLINDKKRSVVPTAQSVCVRACVHACKVLLPACPC